MTGAYAVLLMRGLATLAAIVGAWPFFREAMTHPSFTRPAYRLFALGVILALLTLILCAIWL